MFCLHSFQGELMHKRGYGKGQDVVLAHKVATHWAGVLNLLTSAELLQQMCAKNLFYSIWNLLWNHMLLSNSFIGVYHSFPIPKDTYTHTFFQVTRHVFNNCKFSCRTVFHGNIKKFQKHTLPLSQLSTECYLTFYFKFTIFTSICYYIIKVYK